MERWSRGAGVLFSVVAIISFALFGDQPKVDDSASDVVSFYGDNRGRIALAVVLFLVSFVILAWFAGALATALRNGGESSLATSFTLLLAVFIAMQFVLGMLVAGLGEALKNGTVSADVAQTVNELAWAADTLGAIPLAGAVLAATGGLNRARIMPAWHMWLGLLAALVIFLRGTTWATSGFWSPSGGWAYAAIFMAFAWTVVTSVLLYRSAPATTTVAATTAA